MPHRMVKTETKPQPAPATPLRGRSPTGRIETRIDRTATARAEEEEISADPAEEDEATAPTGAKLGMQAERSKDGNSQGEY